MKKYLLIKPVHLLLYIVAAAAAAILGMSFAFVMASFVNLITGASEHELIQTTVLALLWLLAMLGVDSCYRLLRNNYLKRIMVSLRQDLFSAAMNQSVTRFHQGNTASYLADLSVNLQSLNRNYFEPILYFAFTLANFLGALMSMLLIDASTVYMAAALTLLCAAIPLCTKKLIVKKSKEYIGGIDAYTAKLKDFLNGFLVIKSFHILPVIQQRHFDYNEEMERKRLAQDNLQVVIGQVSMLCGLFSTIAAMAFGAYLTLQGRVEGGAIIALSHLIGNVSGVFQQITSLISSVSAAKPLITRFEGLLAQPADAPGGIAIDRIADISLEQVTFSYPDGHTALRNVSVRLDRGKKYAVVGYSGSGKSTLIRLLLRYYDGYDGEITAGGVPLRQVERESLYRRVATVAQDTFLFEDTVRNNIALYSQAEDAQILRAAGGAGLREWIEGLPQGLDTKIVENGGNLSGGEKQRFAIARALLENAELLLLDEFTASLDAETSFWLEQQVLGLDATVVHVTHKLNPVLLRQYDAILALKQGELVECGDYETLMSSQAGYFRGLQAVTAQEPVPA